MSKLNKRKVPNIVRGGYAQPLGNDLYMLHGAKHEQGGIDIGSNPKTGIEAEGGEVVQMKPNELRVLSAQPMLGGNSPAELAVAGANPDKVFNAQEKFKDRHGLRDDGTKAKNGIVYKLPEIVVTPDGNVSREQYLDSVVKGIREDAANKVLSLNKPVIPYLPNISNIFSFMNGKLYKDTNGKYGMSDEERIKAYGIEKTKFKTCASTATCGYPKNNRWTSNKLFAKNPNEKGFTKINKKDFNIGDLVQYSDDNGPHHVGIATGIEGNNILVTDSNGGTNPEDLRKNRKEYNKNNKKLDYYRFVGTEDDKTKWNNYYDIMYKKRNGGMIEINGNVKNGLIMTPRSQKKCGGRKKFEDGGSSSTGGKKRSNFGTEGRRNTKIAGTWDEIVRSNPEYIQNMKTVDIADHNARQDAYHATRNAVDYDNAGGNFVQHSSVGKYQNWFDKDNRNLNEGINAATTRYGNTGDNPTGNYRDDRWGEMTDLRHTGRNQTDEQIDQTRFDLRGSGRGVYRDSNGMTKLVETDFKPLQGTNAKLNVPKPNIDLDPIKLQLKPIRKKDNQTSLYGEPNRNWRDEIGLGLGLAGGILDPILRGRKLRDMRGYIARLEDPVKLKTKFNINPQLDATKQAREQAFRDIDANTASSATALARKQNTRNQSLFATNQLWGQKENIETQLINQDKMNLQGVRNRNTTRLNQAGQFNAQVRNNKLALQADNISNGIQNVVNAGLDYLGRKDDKERYKNTLAVIQASNPNVSSQQLAEAGFDWGGYRPSQRRMYGSTAKLGLRKRIKLT